MTEREALKLALEALEAISGSPDDPNNGWRGKGTSQLFACEYCQQVSEDCSKIPHLHKCPVPKAYPAITAIKEALAQPEQEPWECVCGANLYIDANGVPRSKASVEPATVMFKPEQEPVAWMYQDKSTHQVSFQKHMKAFVDHSKTSEVPLYGKPLANHELQCVCGAVWCGDEMVHLPNKTPPQRTWVGLIDEDKQIAFDETQEGGGFWEFADAIEAKLKEKNT